MYKTDEELKHEIMFRYKAGFPLAMSLQIAKSLHPHDAVTKRKLEALAKEISTAEFDVGNTVTFRPYGKRFEVKVVGIKEYFNQIPVYHVRGKGAISQTTGRSILESKLFNPFET